MFQFQRLYLILCLALYAPFLIPNLSLAEPGNGATPSTSPNPKTAPPLESGVRLGAIQHTASGGMLFKQALEESLKPESLLQIVQNFTPPMSSWSWNLEQLSLHESITEFRYRIRPITTKPQSESTSRPTETGMWGYLKTIATTTSSAAYRAATAAKDYAIDQMSERTLVGKLTVEPFSCPAPLEPKGYRLGVDLMASDVFTHNFVEKAYILLCFREIKYPSHAVDINLHLQMLAKPGILFGQLNSSKIEEFGESFSKAWLEALVDAANLKETAISRETNTNLGP